MGNKHSGNYGVLDEEDIDEPLFKELHLVIIGSHGSGKNDIINAIFRKKVFTFWTSFKKHYVKEERTVFGTKVTIVRVPGWSRELTEYQEHRELRQEIKDAVRSFENGPHAFILAIKGNSTLSKKTEATLEKLLTRRFWDHTIILTKEDPEKANNKNIKSLIKALNNRYCVLHNPTGFDDSKKLNEDIALMIAEKEKVPLHFFVDESEKHDESHEKNNLSETLRRKINKLRKINRNSLTERNETKADRERLQKILKIHESPKINSTQSDQSTCVGRNTEGEEKTETTAEIHPTEASRLLGLNNMTSVDDLDQDAIALHWLEQRKSFESTLSEVDLHSWFDCLVKILEDLTEEQFKKMKHKICNIKDDRIRTWHVQDRHRNSLARNMIQHWGEEKCIIYTRDILKDIPRNDKEVKELILPFLQMIKESW